MKKKQKIKINEIKQNTFMNKKIVCQKLNICIQSPPQKKKRKKQLEAQVSLYRSPD